MKDIIALMRLAWREKKLLVASLVCSVFVAVFTGLFVNLVQPILDNLFNPARAQALPQKYRIMDSVFGLLRISREDLVKFLPLLLLVVIFGKGLFTFLANFFMKGVGHRVVKRLRDDLYRNVIHQSSAYFDRVSTGDLMSRLTNDVDKMHQAIAGGLSDFVEELFTLVALLVGIFIIDLRLAVVSFIITPLAVIPLVVFSRQLKKKEPDRAAQDVPDLPPPPRDDRRPQDHQGLHHRGVRDQEVRPGDGQLFPDQPEARLDRQPVLAVHGVHRRGGRRLHPVCRDAADRRWAPSAPATSAPSSLLCLRCITPLNRLNRANNVVQQAVASHQRIQEVLQTAPQIQDGPTAFPLPPVRGRVRFENVSFGYNDGPARPSRASPSR